MFETISGSVYPGVVLSFFHSGSAAKVAQLWSRAARLSKTSR
jgi:hypothetical protein